MKREAAIYLVDDDTDFREATTEFLESEGFVTRAFENGARMLERLDPDLVPMARDDLLKARVLVWRDTLRAGAV